MAGNSSLNAAATQDGYALQVEHLTKRYGGTKALDDLSMHVPKGSIYGFVGRNGAGKTTLIRLICGLQRSAAGGFTLCGIRHDSPEIATARRRMGAVVETPALYMELSALENLKQQYLILGLPSMEGIPGLLRLVGLEGVGRKRAGRFSLGMKQRLGIAMALAGDPEFLVLDEPVNGLDPQGIVELRELLLKLNLERGITILISSHNLDELSRLATHYGIIDRGRMVRELSAEELRAECRKRVRIEATSPTALCRALDAMGASYKAVSGTVVDVFDKISFTELALALAKVGCEVLSVQELDDGLEEYFISLVGGESRD